MRKVLAALFIACGLALVASAGAAPFVSDPDPIPSCDPRTDPRCK